VHCARLDGGCFSGPDEVLESARDCLQRALEADVVAELIQVARDAHGFTETTWWFAADQRIWVFSDVPDGSGGYTLYDDSCSGPTTIARFGNGCTNLSVMGCQQP
jgi:hypothetical protein